MWRWGSWGSRGPACASPSPLLLLPLLVPLLLLLVPLLLLELLLPMLVCVALLGIT